MCAPNLILDDVICSCSMADRQFPHHNMGPYGPPVRLMDRWMTPMRTSRPSPLKPSTEWQPVSSQRASVNLKLIAFTPSFSSFAVFVTLSPTSWPLLFLSLALSGHHSIFSETCLSLSLWLFFSTTEDLCFFSLAPLLPSLSPRDSVCHFSVLFSILVSPSLKG